MPDGAAPVTLLADATAVSDQSALFDVVSANVDSELLRCCEMVLLEGFGEAGITGTVVGADAPTFAVADEQPLLTER